MRAPRKPPLRPLPILLALCAAALFAAAHAQPLLHTVALDATLDLIVVDGLAAFFRLLFVFTGLAVVLFAWTSEEIMGPKRENKGEFFALTVLITAGMMVMAEARDLRPDAVDGMIDTQVAANSMPTSMPPRGPPLACVKCPRPKKPTRSWTISTRWPRATTS